MIDHMTIGVADFARSVEFYDSALKPLGVTRLFTVPTEQTEGIGVTGYGTDRPFFWIAEEDTTRGKLHVAFLAADRAAVDAFYAAALSAGGKDNGAPGLRPNYHAD